MPDDSLIRSFMSEGGMSAMAAFLGWLLWKQGDARVADVKTSHERELAVINKVLELVSRTNETLLNKGIEQVQEVRSAVCNLTDEIGELRKESAARR